MAVAVEVEDVGNVDPERLHHGYPRWRCGEIPGFDQLLRECRVKVGCHRLVAREWLVAVAMRESHGRLPAGDAVVGAEVEVDGHPLLRARRCVIEGIDLLDPHRVIALGALPLADSQREAVLVVPPFPDKSDIDFQFTGEEELVWRREDGDRANRPRDDRQSVLCPQNVDLTGIAGCDPQRPTLTSRVIPQQSWERLGRETFESALVDEGDRRLIGLGDGLQAQEVGSAVDREPQSAGEDTHGEAGKRDLQPGSVGPDHDPVGVVGGGRPANLLGVVQGSVPENIPAIRLREPMPGASDAGRDVEFGNQVPSEGDPLPALLPNRQFPDCRHSTQDRESGEALLLTFTVPA